MKWSGCGGGGCRGRKVRGSPQHPSRLRVSNPVPSVPFIRPPSKSFGSDVRGTVRARNSSRNERERVGEGGKGRETEICRCRWRALETRGTLSSLYSLS